jgi:hypothetical protein
VTFDVLIADTLGVRTTFTALHLGAALGTLRTEMTKAHLHTGVVTPVAIPALAVERFGVAPRRADWASVFE